MVVGQCLRQGDIGHLPGEVQIAEHKVPVHTGHIPAIELDTGVVCLDMVGYPDRQVGEERRGLDDSVGFEDKLL